MGKSSTFIPNKLRSWIEARKKFNLSHAQIQMARELGMNPKKFGSLANHKQEPWKAPLPVFIQDCYYKRFRKRQPENVRSIEQIVKGEKLKKEEKKKLKLDRLNHGICDGSHLQILDKKIDEYCRENCEGHAAELKKIAHDAITEVLIALSRDDEKSNKFLDFLEMTIPKYWEKSSVSQSTDCDDSIENRNIIEQSSQLAMLFSMHIRNEMEEFHVKNFDDDQMKKLNQMIRQAVFDELREGMKVSSSAARTDFESLSFSQK